LTNGAVTDNGIGFASEGGGAWCESSASTISNCLIIRNAAYYSGDRVSGGILYNCIIKANRIASIHSGLTNYSWPSRNDDLH
jgi:hypothetical protein